MQPTHTIWIHRIRQKFEKEPPPHPTVLTPHTNRRHFLIIIAVKYDPTQLYRGEFHSENREVYHKSY